MSGNSFGKLFRISTFGESHAEALGVVVDGCPAGLPLDLAAIQYELSRRRPGQSKIVSPRKEKDEFQLVSGVFEGKTLGTPLCFLVLNTDAKSRDYEALKDLFRPGHADFASFAKYGHRDHRGGGRLSARETISRVIGGAIAKQLLGGFGIKIFGGVTRIGRIKAENYVWEQVEKNEVHSVDPLTVSAMLEEIEAARRDRDSIGGIVEVIATGVRPGLGEPVFEKLDALLASALLSIPAVKGVEFGLGFAAAALRGSQMNDPMTPEGFVSNNHGGVLGGMSTGAPLVARLVVKPTSSIPQDQQTIDTSFHAQTVAISGRHDPCVAIRAVPIAEAMVALVLIDFLLEDEARRGVRASYDPCPVLSYGLKK